MYKTALSKLSKEISSGLTPLRSNPEFWNNGVIPWVKTEQLGVKNIYDSNEKVSLKAFEQTGLKCYPINTLSIAMYGEGKTRGRVSILKNEMTTNQACCNVIIDREKAYFEYVYYFLNTQYEQLRSLSSGIRKNLNSNDIKNFEIRLPKNIQTQKIIAKILSDLDTKIELNNKINRELEAMAKTLYDYWFVQFDFPDTNGKPYKSSGGKMVWNKILKRKIPFNWNECVLKDCVKIRRGVSYSSENYKGDGIPMINLNSFLNNSQYKETGIKYFSGEYPKEKRLKAFDLVMCNTQQTDLNPNKDIIGKAFLVPDIFNADVISSHHVTSILVNDNELKVYLNAVFKTEYFHKYISGYVNGTNIKGLDFNGLHQFSVPIPDSKLLTKFADISMNFEKRKSLVIRENQQLVLLRDWLLPMLMNGQVKVADSPAEGKVYQMNDVVCMAAEPER